MRKKEVRIVRQRVAITFLMFYSVAEMGFHTERSKQTSNKDQLFFTRQTVKARPSVSRINQTINYHNIAVMCTTFHFRLQANFVAFAFFPFIGY